MYVIAVSGTPGTGKTTFSKKICRRFGFEYLDVNDIILKFGLSEAFDKDRSCHVIDEKKLIKCLKKVISTKSRQRDSPRGIVVDSHMAHYLPSELVDVCIITKISLRRLKNRLNKRGYSDSKVRENLDAEIFDICYNEALELGHMILVVGSQAVLEFYVRLAELLDLD